MKPTGSLNAESARQPERPTGSRRLSGSTALERAGRSRTERAPPDEGERLDALDHLQSRLVLDRGAAAGWEQQVKRERRGEGEGT